jgi:hypothetical protein
MKLGLWRLSLVAIVSLARPTLAQPALAQPLPRTEWSPADEAARQPHHGRSLWQMVGGLGLGTAGYFLLLNRNIVDWDSPALRQRFDGTAWVLDNNNLGVNFLGHPATGALSYSFARANHQSVLGAFGYAFLTSSLWELAIEFKEKVSVNDMIVTPGAAVPLGEFFYKLGLYLDSGHHASSGVGALRWLLGTGVMVDRALDGRPAPHVRSRDALGFSSKIWHELEVSHAARWISTPALGDYTRLDARGRARLVTLEDYLSQRSFGRAFWGAEISDLALGIEGSRHGAGLTVEADTVLAGHHGQRVRASRFEVAVDSVTIGSSIGFDYLYASSNRYAAVEAAVALPEPNVKYHLARRREQYGALHLPGLAAELLVRRRLGRLWLSARLQPSFAGLSAPAFYDWAAAHPDERSKHILHRQGYFYGWGGAAHLGARLSVGALRAAGELTYAAYASQDGLDRHREQVSTDTAVTGSFLRYSGRLGVAVRPDVELSLDYGVRRWRSRVVTFERTARLEERGVSARWSF